MQISRRKSLPFSTKSYDERFQRTLVDYIGDNYNDVFPRSKEKKLYYYYFIRYSDCNLIIGQMPLSSALNIKYKDTKVSDPLRHIHKYFYKKHIINNLRRLSNSLLVIMMEKEKQVRKDLPTVHLKTIDLILKVGLFSQANRSEGFWKQRTAIIVVCTISIHLRKWAILDKRLQYPITFFSFKQRKNRRCNISIPYYVIHGEWWLRLVNKSNKNALG